MIPVEVSTSVGDLVVKVATGEVGSISSGGLSISGLRADPLGVKVDVEETV